MFGITSNIFLGKFLIGHHINRYLFNIFVYSEILSNILYNRHTIMRGSI